MFQLSGIRYNRRHIHDTGDIRTAVADKYADSDFLITHMILSSPSPVNPELDLLIINFRIPNDTSQIRISNIEIRNKFERQKFKAQNRKN
jgi:hypothetical protein